MTYDPTKHHRRSIRLPAYDYRQAGAYFVTICAQNRECVFGQVVNGQVILNGPGQMVESVWRGLPENYPGVEVDAFVVMPNHVHGIIILVGADPRVGPPDPRARPDPSGQPQGVAPTEIMSLPDNVGAGPRARPDKSGQPQGVAPTEIMSLPDVVHRFKSLTTAKYRHGVRQNGWQPFPGRLWQRNYYEHVIRTEEELTRIRQYILDNPANWPQDRENPALPSSRGTNAPL